MTLLVSAQSLTKTFGTKRLFENLALSLFQGDRVGLIGPNGAGKSTLLKILAAEEKASSGLVSVRKGTRIGYVPQSCHFPDVPVGDLLLSSFPKEDMRPDYEKKNLVETWLSKVGFDDPGRSAAALSGGWKKRLSLVRALLLSPDLLLLDEPTNHLDLEGIVWLERFLLKEVPTYLLVSHDRYFLKHMVDRIIEIDPVYPEGLISIAGSYELFLEKKELFLKGQLEQERSLASKARRELDWLKRSPKARTTKSQSRVDAAHELMEEHREVGERNLQKRVSIDFSSTGRETEKLLVAKNLRKSMGEKVLFQHLDFTLSPGTRLGLMGPNGSGKTTLLKLLAGELKPDEGTIKQVEDLKIVYFDQHRAKLPDEITLRKALAPQGDFVTFRGKQVHLNGWCQRFLFSPDLLDIPLSKLSGGERARISIAHLMLQPADLLLLDEPTNDLDIPTLEMFEESLLDFPGAVVLITHDRCMLERISTTLLSLGNLDQNQFFADYAQWESAKIPKQEEKKREKKQRSYTDKKELDQIESKINRLEEEVKQLNQKLLDPSLAHKAELLQAIYAEVALLENRIEQLYLRFDELS